MSKIITISLVSIITVAITAIPAFQASAALLDTPDTLVCRGLAMTGFACDPRPVASNYQPKRTQLYFDIFGEPISKRDSSGASISDDKTTIKNSKAPRDLEGQKINLVSVPNSNEIYMLVKGQKHIFPSLAVFYDYGYTLAMVQPISQYQLDKYPRAKLLKVKGDSKIYYLTEGGMVRQLLNPKKIFDIYGDREEDVITISRKEFNYYPANEYVYQISPLNRDVFQITEEGKRYLTPMAVARLNLRLNQIAPVAQAELNMYKTLPPVID